MRAFVLTLIAALACSTAHAKPEQPNTLTPKEIADGWILLFDGESTFGWDRPEGATWSVKDGAIEVMTANASTIATTTRFSDFELEAEVWKEGGATPTVGVADEKTNSLSPGLARNTQFMLANGQNGRWIGMKITVQHGNMNGNRRSAVVNGHNVMPERVRVALASTGGGTARFRKIKLRPLRLKSIFNGKDLSGWKVIPDHKSVFSVTPEGWLNIKNGNGEIQTTGEWTDFVLQLEVYSNGDHLNSGVFFREQPGVFWGGYEAQIRNQWEGDDRNKAVDYGTGGIYNRQPARRVVSSDREWFTMTVVADGTHLATWVNGFQVTDFEDQRLPNEENARNGARTKAGVLGLQGHDPTTDLSFRNIRIAELPTSQPPRSR